MFFCNYSERIRHERIRCINISNSAATGKLPGKDGADGEAGVAVGALVFPGGTSGLEEGGRGLGYVRSAGGRGPVVALRSGSGRAAVIIACKRNGESITCCLAGEDNFLRVVHIGASAEKFLPFGNGGSAPLASP